MTTQGITIKMGNQSDEHGIFMSMLYLIGESQKRGFSLTAAKLILAARALIDESEDGSITNDLSAALDFYIHCLAYGDSRTMEIVRALDGMDSAALDNC